MEQEVRSVGSGALTTDMCKSLRGVKQPRFVCRLGCVFVLCDGDTRRTRRSLFGRCLVRLSSVGEYSFASPVSAIIDGITQHRLYTIRLIMVDTGTVGSGVSQVNIPSPPLSIHR